MEGRDANTWKWLSQSDFKRETEGMIEAAQDQALRTSYMQKEINIRIFLQNVGCAVIGKRPLLI